MAPILSNIKLCASFHPHMWIRTGVTVRKRLSGVMTSVTLTFDLWPWPFAWTSRLSMVISPENFRMIRWQEHCQKGVTDGQTDGQTQISVLRAAWSQLKTRGPTLNLEEHHCILLESQSNLGNIPFAYGFSSNLRTNWVHYQQCRTFPAFSVKFRGLWNRSIWKYPINRHQSTNYYLSDPANRQWPCVDWFVWNVF